MKKIIYFIILVSLWACSSQKKEQTDEQQNPKNDTTLRAVKKETENKNLQKIATFTDEELQKRIGKLEPKSVRDLFLLIPEDCFYFGSKVEERKEMLDGKPQSPGIIVESCDEKNNYLKLTEFEGKWEMFARQLAPELWEIIVNVQSCGEYCVTEKILCFHYKENTLFQTDNSLIKQCQDYELEKFIEPELFDKQQWQGLKETFETEMNVLFDLPTDGKTLKVYIDDEAIFQYVADFEQSKLKTIEIDIAKR